MDLKKDPIPELIFAADSDFASLAGDPASTLVGVRDFSFVGDSFTFFNGDFGSRVTFGAYFVNCFATNM